MSNFKIVMTGHGRGEVFKDGVKVEHVRAVKFEANVGQANTITLEFTAERVEIESEAELIEVRCADDAEPRYLPGAIDPAGEAAAFMRELREEPVYRRAPPTLWQRFKRWAMQHATDFGPGYG